MQKGRITGICSASPRSSWGTVLGRKLVQANKGLPLTSVWSIDEMRRIAERGTGDGTPVGCGRQFRDDRGSFAAGLLEGIVRRAGRAHRSPSVATDGLRPPLKPPLLLLVLLGLELDRLVGAMRPSLSASMALNSSSVPSHSRRDVPVVIPVHLAEPDGALPRGTDRGDATIPPVNTTGWGKKLLLACPTVMRRVRGRSACVSLPSLARGFSRAEAVFILRTDSRLSPSASRTGNTAPEVVGGDRDARVLARRHEVEPVDEFDPRQLAVGVLVGLREDLEQERLLPLPRRCRASTWPFLPAAMSYWPR